MIKELFLYSTKECQLCLQMQAALDRMLPARGITCQVIDIAGDAELQHRYGARLPVLVSGNQEICEVVLDVKALETFLRAEEP